MEEGKSEVGRSKRSRLRFCCFVFFYMLDGMKFEF